MESMKESKFKVIDSEGSEFEVKASSFHDAALKYAKQDNEDNDHYLIGECVEIEIVSETKITQKYYIGAEPDIHYSARKAV